MKWYIRLVFSMIYQSSFLLCIYKCYKYLYGWATNSTEIYRICIKAAQHLSLQHDLVSDDTNDLLDDMDGHDSDPDSDEKVSEVIPLLKTTSATTTTGIDAVAATEKRIVVGSIPAATLFRIDRSILYSTKLATERRQLESKTCPIDDLTQSIMLKKRFPGSHSSPEVLVLRGSLEKIAATYELTREINEKAHTKYDCSDNIHEQKLLKLWTYLMPDTQLESRLTRQWGEIGFQGNDPASDFRGMGIQGLDDLIYYAKTYPESSQHVFLSSRHPVSWYPFAIVGINISQFTIQILRTRQLQYYLFQYGISRDTYQDVYCFLYHTFNEYWNSHEGPRLTVMEFEQTFKKFKQIIHGQILTQELMPLSVYMKQQDEQRQEQQQQQQQQRRRQEGQEDVADGYKHTDDSSGLHYRLPHVNSTLSSE